MLAYNSWKGFCYCYSCPPTVIKEPEKPAEETAEGATEGGETTTAEGADSKAAQAKDGKEPDTKKDEKSKDGQQIKNLSLLKKNHKRKNNLVCFY